MKILWKSPETGHFALILQGIFCEAIRKKPQNLVAQCSAIGVSVAATPPCSAIRFCKDISLRHWQGGWQDRCDRVFFCEGWRGVARHPRDIFKTAGIFRSSQTGTLQTGTLRIRGKSLEGRQQWRERRGKGCPSGKNMRPANSLKVRVSLAHWNSKYPFTKYPFASPPNLLRHCVRDTV